MSMSVSEEILAENANFRLVNSRSVSMLVDALHAHRRGDKSHVVEDHLERVLADLIRLQDKYHA